ncbi:hypothetical protein HA520_20845 [Azotobacter chroococcum]|uniref:Lipoprotein n=1 Tax=Azotobacter chroococcum TaxID=353 RepID=A0AA43ZA00_9GAMM|nr:hypothetical protein [Azotobacter chroococcum]NHN79690.1 hypothetical protein [Azotobacter chroococcum]
MVLDSFFRLAVASLFFGSLAGCSSSSSVDESPVIRSFVLPNTTLEDVYFKLTANRPAWTICSTPLSPQYYPGRQEFRVYYGGVSALGPSHHLGVYGTQEGQNVKVDMKVKMWTDRSARQIENYLRTGDCS